MNASPPRRACAPRRAGRPRGRRLALRLTATRTRPDRIDLTGNRPASIGPDALAEGLAPALPPETHLRDRAKAAHGAPPDFTLAASYALSTLKDMLPGASVSLEDTRLSLHGEAASVADEVALRAALATPPPDTPWAPSEILRPW